MFSLVNTFFTFLLTSFFLHTSSLRCRVWIDSITIIVTFISLADKIFEHFIHVHFYVLFHVHFIRFIRFIVRFSLLIPDKYCLDWGKVDCNMTVCERVLMVVRVTSRHVNQNFLLACTGESFQCNFLAFGHSYCNDLEPKPCHFVRYLKIFHRIFGILNCWFSVMMFHVMFFPFFIFFFMCFSLYLHISHHKFVSYSLLCVSRCFTYIYMFHITSLFW